MNVFLIISWILGGALAGGIGIIGFASTIDIAPRGDIGSAFIYLLIGVAIGAAGGGILGRMIQQKFVGNPDKLSLFAGVPWVAGLVLVVGINTFGQPPAVRGSPDMIRPDGGGLSLIYEVRLPPGVPEPANNRSFLIELRTPEEVKPADSIRVRQEDDRVMIQGHFWVYKAAPKRIITFRVGDGPPSLFTMNLAARPADNRGRWSRWQKADDSGDKPSSATPNEAIEIRYAANY